MKKIYTEIPCKTGVSKRIFVFVDEETEKIFREIDEDIRREYILEEKKGCNRTRAETRRHISYESLIGQAGNELPSSDENPEDKLVRKERYSNLHKALQTLTDKQYKTLVLIAVDELSFHEAGEIMGVRWETVREHYKAAIKKVRKNF